ncbi:MAG TPA: type III pantothenate kinase [bacterium]|nr:type III pantothenate kinase [bacterium]
MLLAVDAGNTETVLGVFEKDCLRAHWRLSSRSTRTADECLILLKIWCETAGLVPSDISGMVISSVVPSWTTVFTELARSFLGITPLIVTAGIDTGLTILYETPGSVGADRICNAVAAYRLFGAPLVVVDFGTATTFDVVTPQCEYRGGAIALGLMGASRELHRISAKLPRVELRFPTHVVGRTTEESIQSGVLWGTVSMVDGMVDHIVREMAWQDVRVVATGGLATALAERSERIQQVEPFLTLEGMRFIFERNSKAS